MSSTAARKRALLAALAKTLGIVTTACKAAKIDPQTFYNWYRDDPKFAKQADYIRDEMSVDFAESALYQRIKEGDTTAIIFQLKSRGKKRGYGDKQELVVTEQTRFEKTMQQFSPDYDDYINEENNENQ